MGIFKYGLFTVCVMVILNPKRFPGLSVSFLQSSTQIINMMEISAVLGRNFVNKRSLRQRLFALCNYLVVDFCPQGQYFWYDGFQRPKIKGTHL